MSDLDMNKLREELGIGALTDLVKNLNATQEAERKQKEAEAKEAAELARVEKLISKATGEDRQKLEEAHTLVKTLEEKLQKSNEVFASTVEKLQAEISAKSTEISQILAAREGKSFVGNAVSKAILGDQAQFEKSVESVVLLGYIMQKDMFSTALGSAHQKAVNASSSIQVSSEHYETIFSQNILRDIQKELVVGNLFMDLPMTSKNLTMMIEPETGSATWVEAANYGTNNTNGAEQTTVLGEKTFSTLKLAAKAYMTDETVEDAIVPLLPIIRRRLVEAHANAIEDAFMNGTGAAGVPKGLLKLAAEDTAVVTTTAKADGTVKVSGLMIQQMRRKLGRHGKNVNKLALVVSMDAYYDLLEDPEFQDVSQVSDGNAVKLTGQLGRIYGMPVLVSEWFPAKAVSTAYAALVYTDNFVIPRQRQVTVERERIASQGKDAFYVTQRLNLQRLIDGKGIATATYAAA